MAGARVPSPPLIDDEPGAARHATWLELFSDLVFVVAVSQLAGDLAHHPDGEGFLRFGALFVPLWWGWVGYAFFATRFECDDAVTRILWLAGMLAAAAMA